MEILEYNIGAKARAFSTMRGEGTGNYEGFNITFYCGDTDKHVSECRKRLCLELGINDSRLLLPRQIHSDKICIIDEQFMQKPKEEQEKMLYGIDAIVTNLRGTCIGVSTADCIPLLLHDSKKGIIAAIHAGWRGTVSRIAEKTIKAMTEYYGCSPYDIRAIIGPGISLDSFEVGDEVYEEFRCAGFDCRRIARRYPTDNGKKWHIDLWEANRMQLLLCGIDENSIHSAAVCTYKEHDRFFSARRLGIKSGRIFNGIMLL